MKTEKVAVIGAGTMGRGIAHVVALGGMDVSLYDVDPAALKRALETISRNLEKGEQLGKVEAGGAKKAAARIRLTDDLADAASAADVVIESAPEDLELKMKLFRDLDQICKADAILASNTSAKSITEIASATTRPHKVIGLHFFNPVHLMRLVEIVVGLETDKETIDASIELCGQMSKDHVVINEYPGFITSRINALIGNEAFHMLEAGVASAQDIDKACRLGLNHPMGPFEMIDIVGLDTRLKILEYLNASLGEKFRPAPLLVKLVKAGRLGKKVGRGVYEYNSDSGKGR